MGSEDDGVKCFQALRVFKGTTIGKDERKHLYFWRKGDAESSGESYYYHGL